MFSNKITKLTLLILCSCGVLIYIVMLQKYGPTGPKIMIIETHNPTENKNEDSLNLAEYKWSNRDHPIMRMIHDTQFPEDCKNKKFMVYQLGGLKSRNIGSITTQITHWLAEAVHSNRILIFGDQDWEQARDCPSKTWDCYFRPISSCSMADIPAGTEIVKAPKGYTENTAEDEKDIVAFYCTKSWWRMNNGEIKKWLDIKPEVFHAYAFTFMLRLNQKFQSKVESNIKVLMEKYHDLDPAKSISMPIRGSDKCKGHTMEHSSPGEDSCLPIKTYIDAIDKYRCQYYECDPNQLTNIIVTSEDEKMVYEAAELGTKSKWNVIINEFDVMQGTGSANALDKVKNSVSHDDVIVSVFTSLQLQLRGKYFVKKREKTPSYSSWIYIIEEILTRVDESTFGGRFDRTHIIKLY